MINKESLSSDSKYIFLSFLFWPFLGLVMAFNNIRSSFTKNILWAFCGVIGMTYIITIGSDMFSYVYKFNMVKSMDLNYIKVIINNYYSGKQVDIFMDMLIFIVSRFLNNSYAFVSILSLIFGYFYTRYVWKIIGASKNRFNINSAIFLIGIFLIVNPIGGINQFRFWFASTLFIYGIFGYVYEKKKHYIFIVFSSVLVHFALGVVLIPFLVFLVFGNRFYIYLSIFILSLFLPNINYELISGYMPFLGDAYTSRFNGYTSEQNVERFSAFKNAVWYASLWRPVLKNSLTLVYIYIGFFVYKKLSKELKYFLSIILLIFTVLNFISDFTMIFRYWQLLFYFSFTFFFLYFDFFDYKKINKVTIILFPGYFLTMAFMVRQILNFTNGFIFIANPITILFLPTDFSIYNFIK